MLRLVTVTVSQRLLVEVVVEVVVGAVVKVVGKAVVEGLQYQRKIIQTCRWLSLQTPHCCLNINASLTACTRTSV
jgi:hypothetical protein